MTAMPACACIIAVLIWINVGALHYSWWWSYVYIWEGKELLSSCLEPSTMQETALFPEQLNMHLLPGPCGTRWVCAKGPVATRALRQTPTTHSIMNCACPFHFITLLSLHVPNLKLKQKLLQSYSKYLSIALSFFWGLFTHLLLLEWESGFSATCPGFHV